MNLLNPAFVILLLKVVGHLVRGFQRASSESSKRPAVQSDTRRVGRARAHATPCDLADPVLLQEFVFCSLVHGLQVSPGCFLHLA